jgi:hypothetical protein
MTSGRVSKANSLVTMEYWSERSTTVRSSLEGMTTTARRKAITLCFYMYVYQTTFRVKLLVYYVICDLYIIYHILTTAIHAFVLFDFLHIQGQHWLYKSKDLTVGYHEWWFNNNVQLSIFQHTLLCGHDLPHRYHQRGWGANLKIFNCEIPICLRKTVIFF